MKQFGEIKGIKIAFTDHALARMVEMKVTPEEIQDLILDPEETYSSKKYSDATCQRRGKFSVALDWMNTTQVTVITVLYASLEDWCDAARDGLLADRTLRPDTGIPRRRHTS